VERKIYHSVNNGVYRCGFAQTQEAYDEACNQLFALWMRLTQRWRRVDTFVTVSHWRMSVSHDVIPL